MSEKPHPRAAAKAAARRKTAAAIADGKLTPEQAQLQAAPIEGKIHIVDLFGDLKRYASRHRKRS